MSKFTSGPWEARLLEADGTIIKKAAWEIFTPDYDVVAQHPYIPPIRKEADAQLISAAPEMYETLKKIERVYIAGGEATKGDLFTLIQVMKSTAQQAIKGVE